MCLILIIFILILYCDNILDRLDEIQYTIKINFTCFCLSTFEYAYQTNYYYIRDLHFISTGHCYFIGFHVILRKGCLADWLTPITDCQQDWWGTVWKRVEEERKQGHTEEHGALKSPKKPSSFPSLPLSLHDTRVVTHPSSITFLWYQSTGSFWLCPCGTGVASQWGVFLFIAPRCFYLTLIPSHPAHFSPAGSLIRCSVNQHSWGWRSSGCSRILSTVEKNRGPQDKIPSCYPWSREVSKLLLKSVHTVQKLIWTFPKDR